MTVKAYLYVLIVSSFLGQEIIARLSDEDTRKSSDFLVRNKRVINHEPNGNALPRFEDIKYIVNIKENSRMHCVGAILSHLTVITAAICFTQELNSYKVLSGSSYTYNGRPHDIISKVVHYGNPPISRMDGIGLVKVDPPFVFGDKTGLINLHVEPILTGTLALISGWGCHHPTSPSMVRRNRLRSITLPIMNQRECVSTYKNYFAITNKHICTYDERKLCGLGDIGTPLVVDNSLVGIHIYKGVSTRWKSPDVFVDVQSTEFSVWIRENI